jgi:putative Mn2+ efflux pump MntP
MAISINPPFGYWNLLPAVFFVMLFCQISHWKRNEKRPTIAYWVTIVLELCALPFVAIVIFLPTASVNDLVNILFIFVIEGAACLLGWGLGARFQKFGSAVDEIVSGFNGDWRATLYRETPKPKAK